MNGGCSDLPTTCGPSNCTGCCDSHGTCQTGDKNDLCGTGGGACGTCGTGRACVAGDCKCTAASCPDGCCQGDQCMSGSQQSACGKAGAQCTVCSGADTCDNGACSVTCNDKNCVGCCDGNTCKSGSVPAACGTNGQACTACTGDQQCVNGTCNDTSCTPQTCPSGCCAGGVCQAGTSDSQCGKAGAVCGACKWYQSCATQACGFDGSSLWFVDLVDVKLVNTVKWDPSPNVAPEVYVTVTSGGESHTTATAAEGYTPVFNEYLFLVTADDLMTQIKFQIKDEDTLFDDTICNIDEVIYQFELENGQATIPYPCDNVESITLKFY